MLGKQVKHKKPNLKIILTSQVQVQKPSQPQFEDLEADLDGIGVEEIDGYQSCGGDENVENLSGMMMTYYYSRLFNFIFWVK